MDWEDASSETSSSRGWEPRSRRSSLYDRSGQAKLSLPKRPGHGYHRLRTVAKKHNRDAVPGGKASADMFQIYREVVGL